MIIYYWNVYKVTIFEMGIAHDGLLIDTYEAKKDALVDAAARNRSRPWWEILVGTKYEVDYN